jgi:hypothetical protein
MPVDAPRVSARRFDFSRETFDPASHFRSVIGLQGRVTVEADLNEQRRIDLHRDDTTSADVIGRAGVPKGTTGFAIAANGGDLTIGPGRMYIAGILCENESASAALLSQPDLPIGTGGLRDAPGFSGAGTYAVDLLAWERDITFIDAPQIREKALGGPDTSARTKTVWQVVLRPVPQGTTCATLPPIAVEAHDGALSARTVPAAAARNCALPPAAGYQGLENQLYRVEIHRGNTGGATATFKWSRENGSVVTGIVATPQSGILGQTFNVLSLGADQTLGFNRNQWIELSDDLTTLRGQPGTLAFIQDVDPGTQRITLSAPPAGTIDLARNPRMRRWEQSDPSQTNGVPIVFNTPIDLEQGIQVTFQGGNYFPGDYWIIPARTAIDETTGVLDWPSAPQPAQYAARHIATLAVVTFDGTNFALVGDCRSPFPPLTAIAASDVSYVPGCPDLAGATTVQQAIDLLCRRAGGGCVVAVAPGQLEAVLKSLIEQKAVEICLCLLPGEHKLAGEVALDTANLSVSINGCGGDATRLLITQKPFEVAVQSFALRQLTLVADILQAPAVVARAQSVTLDGVAVAGITASPQGLLDFDALDRVMVSDTIIEAYRATTFAGIAELLSELTGNPDMFKSPVRADFIQGAQQAPAHLQAMPAPFRLRLMDRIRSQVTAAVQAGRMPAQEAAAIGQLLDAAARQTLDPREVVLNLVRVRLVLGQITPGVALTLESAAASADFDNCEIIGVLSCYGPPGANPLNPDEKGLLRAQSGAGRITFTDTGRTLRLRNTSLVQLTINDAMLGQIRSVLGNGGQIGEVYTSAFLVDCVFFTGGNFIVSRGTQTSSLRFDAADNLNAIANVLGEYASYVGTCYTGSVPITTGPPNFPQLVSFTSRKFVEAATSEVTIIG